MTLLPSLLHADLARERSREGRRRAAGARRPVRPSFPPVVRAAGDDGGRRGTAPAAVIPGCG